MKKKIELSDLLAIDGGLSYIIHRFPDAAESVNHRNRKFKLRPEEKTASASLKNDNGTYIVKDFGSSDPAMNAVAVAQYLDGTDFITALKAVAAFYKYEGSDVPEAKPDYKSWAAKPEEAEGSMNFEYKEFEIHDLKALFSTNAFNALGHNDEARLAEGSRICAHYHYKCLKSYTQTKEGKTHQYISTELFPMFLIDEGEWKKLYKPKAEKRFRFQSTGNKPASFIHGLAQAQKKVAELVAASATEGGSSEEDLDEGDKPAKKKKKAKEKLEEIILCTGGSDALNVAALGFTVIWQNSETALLSPADYKTLCRLAEKIYNLPDIDVTGKREAHKLAMQYVEIRTIQLPEDLKKRLDANGNPCKDVRDYLKYHRKAEFLELVKVALPYQFWDQDVALDRDGEPRMKFGKLLMEYKFNNVHAYNFLRVNGFARYRSPKEKDGFCYVREQNNIVSKIEASAVKDFIHGFLEERRYPVDLRNAMYKTPYLNDSSISNLAFFEGDFQTYGHDYQYLFFAKNTWKITAAGITEEKVGNLEKHIWEHKVIQRPVKILEDMFRISKTEGGQYDIQLGDNLPTFLKFLIQTSRSHWRKELEERLDLGLMDRAAQLEYCEENNFSQDDLKAMLHWSKPEKQAEYRKKYRFAVDGELLTEEEIQEQKLHLINKIYAIGYLLHRYKNPAKPWAVFVMDAKISENSESHGGAGKGILAKGIYKLVTKVQLDGRNPQLVENKHLLENVDQDTDIIHLEDAHESLPFGFFYAPLTSATTINPKQKRSFELEYAVSPKWLFDTNFGDRYTDPSSRRRKLYVAFSDYYHENTGDYRESRSPADEFGMNLFDDWDEAEWNRFYNFMAQCVKFYLGCNDKLEAPLANLSKRNLIAVMGDHFRNWADAYFSPEAARLDKLIPKEDAQEDLFRSSKIKMTSQAFKRALKAWCNFNDFEYCPKELQGKTGLIIRKNAEDKTAEFIYIRTHGAEINDIKKL
ncbi:hypothetical protein LX87_05205 [Larkinella arboricola]|uniref:Uncharacterized protein n=1 Tax=Larkinella arboricola TaxID=643671 RepID=A0A327WNT8_LARAB|nr:hypothetical protein [Larkinella arboricola]RAJ92237.1 hypothetical protein LX87_05205 [Larkinella arboricola]